MFVYLYYKKKHTQSQSLLHSIFNYDPRVRLHAMENLLLTFLLPPKMKTKSAHKFYALLEDELAELYYTGIAGGDLKGALIMVRADQKGKEFDLGLKSVTSYAAPCNVCELLAQPGYGRFTKTCVGEYRRFLPNDHPYRHDPSFGEPEPRPRPDLRSQAKSEQAIAIVNDPRCGLNEHYMGYRDLALFSGLKYFRPFVQSAVDLSHNLANFFKGVLNTVQPNDSLIANWRLEASLSGRFPDIGPRVPQYVHPGVAQAFLDLDLQELRVVDLKECARMLGTSLSGNKTDLQDRIQRILRSFRGNV